MKKKQSVGVHGGSDREAKRVEGDDFNDGITVAEQ